MFKTRNIFITIALLLSLSGLALAGTFHLESGQVYDASDGTNSNGSNFFVYNLVRPTELSTGNVGDVLSQIWMKSVGEDLFTEWQVGDNHLAVIYKELMSGTTQHRGYYAVTNKNLSGDSPDEFNATTLRRISSPNVSAQNLVNLVSWSTPIEDIGNPATTNIIGFELYRSTNNINFQRISTNVTTINYQDTFVSANVGYYYAVNYIFRGGVTLNIYSAGSSQVIFLKQEPGEIDNFEDGDINLAPAWYIYDNVSISNTNNAFQSSFAMQVTGSASAWYIGGTGINYSENVATFNHIALALRNIYGVTARADLTLHEYDGDTWTYAIPITWSGWQDLDIPLSSFVRSGTGDGIYNPPSITGNIPQINFNLLYANSSDFNKPVGFSVDNIRFLTGNALEDSALKIIQLKPSGNSYYAPVASSLKIVFNKAVDRPSVESAFSIYPPVAGMMSWVDNMLIFTPVKNLLPFTIYTVSINNLLAKDLAGQTITGQTSWQFNTNATSASGYNPEVLAYAPTGLNVPLNPTIELIFSESINQNTLSGALTLADNGGNPVPGVITMFGNTIIYTPSNPLAANTIYTISVNSTLQDNTGDSAISFSSSFKTSAGVGGTPPIILAHGPVGLGATTNITLNVLFSESMNQANVQTDFLVSGNPSGAFSWTGNLLSFKSNTILVSDTWYSATINAGVLDSEGDGLATIDNWRFQTKKLLAPPTLLSPSQNASSVLASESFNLSYIIPDCDFSSVNSSIYLGIENKPLVLFRTYLSVGVKITNNVDIGPLESATTYNWKVVLSDPTDPANYLESEIYSFRTAYVTVDLKIIQNTPSGNYYYAPVASSLKIVFNKAVDRPSVESAFSIYPPVAGMMSWVDNTLIFTPVSNLLPSTVYTVSINNTLAKGLNGQTLTGQISWQFNTNTIKARGYNPTVLGYAPRGSNVPLNPTIELIFSESISQNTLVTGINFVNSAGSTIPGTFSIFGNTVIFTPNNLLVANTTYNLSVNSTLKDNTGDSANSFFWSFKTGSGGTGTPPLILAHGPVGSGVNLNSTLNVLFSEAMNQVNVQNNFVVSGNPAGSISWDGNLFSFKPNTNLVFGSWYSATINAGVLDSEGDSLTTANVWSFQASNTLPPTPSNIVPGNGAQNVSIGTDLSFLVPLVSLYTVNVDVYFATENESLSLITANKEIIAGQEFRLNPGLLSTDTTYNWQVIVKDPLDLSIASTSSLLVFHTKGLPTQPQLIYPTNNAQGVLLVNNKIQLKFALPATSNYDQVNADVYMSKAGEPWFLAISNLVLSKGENKLIQLGGIEPETSYNWKVMAKDKVYPTLFSESQAQTFRTEKLGVIANFENEYSEGGPYWHLQGALRPLSVTSNFCGTHALKVTGNAASWYVGGMENLLAQNISGYNQITLYARNIAERPAVLEVKLRDDQGNAWFNSQIIDGSDWRPITFSLASLKPDKYSGNNGQYIWNPNCSITNIVLQLIYANQVDFGLDLGLEIDQLRLVNNSLDEANPFLMEKSPVSIFGPTGTTIKATFSEAMNKSTVESAFSINPPVVGDFQWFENSLLFTPSSELAPGVSYNVAFNPAIARDLNSQPLSGNTSWQFTTTTNIGGKSSYKPEILAYSPRGFNVSPTTEITILFSEAMSTNSVERGLQFNDNFWQATWDKHSLILRPRAPLVGNKKYTIAINSGVADAGGDTLNETFTWSFQTGKFEPPPFNDSPAASLIRVIADRASVGIGLNKIRIRSLQANLPTPQISLITATSSSNLELTLLNKFAHFSLWQVSFTPSASWQSGVITINATVTDKDGFVSYVVLATANIMTEAPNILNITEAQTYNFGETLTISALVSSNIALAKVMVSIRRPQVTGSEISIPMRKIVGNRYQIFLPAGFLKQAALEYKFSARDIAGNSQQTTTWNLLTAMDNLPPELEHQALSVNAAQVKLLFRVKALDNVGVLGVTLNYQIVGQLSQSRPMLLMGGQYLCTLMAGEIAGSNQIHYYLEAADNSGNQIFWTANGLKYSRSEALSNSQNITLLNTTLPVIAHTPVALASFDQDLAIAADASGATGLAQLKLWYKNSSNSTNWRRKVMRADRQSYIAKIEGQYVKPGLAYYLEAIDFKSKSTFTPTAQVAVSQNALPVLTHFAINTTVRALTLNFWVEASSASSGTLTPTLYYRKNQGNWNVVNAAPYFIPASFLDSLESVEYYFQVSAATNTITSPETGTQFIEIIEPDSMQAPFIVEEPINSITQYQTLTLNALALDNGTIQNVTLYWRYANSSTWQQAMLSSLGNGYYQTTISGSNLATTGNLEYYLNAVDDDTQSGGSGTANSPKIVAIVEDKEPPSIEIFQPQVNRTGLTTQNIVGVVADNIKVQSLKIYLNSALSPVAQLSEPSGAFELSGIRLIAGTNTIDIVASDLAGNSSTQSLSIVLEELNFNNANAGLAIKIPTGIAGTNAQVISEKINTADFQVRFGHNIAQSAPAGSTMLDTIVEIQVDEEDSATGTVFAGEGALVQLTLPGVVTGTIVPYWYDQTAGNNGLWSTSGLRWEGIYTPTGKALGVSGNILTFTTTHFSLFSMAEVSNNEVPVQDIDPPVLTISAPLGNQILTSNITIVGTTTDNQSLASYALFLQDENGQTTTLSSGTSAYNSLTELNVNALANGYYSLILRALDTAGNQVSVTVNNLVVLRKAIQPGLAMISFPFSSSADLATLLLDTPALKAARWNAQLATYNYYPALVSVNRAEGLWVSLNTIQTVNATSYTSVKPTDSYSVGLYPYWNQIANPYYYDLSADALNIFYQGTTLSYTQALTRKIIKAGIWTWNQSAQTYELASTFKPWDSYWLKTLQVATLNYSPMRSISGSFPKLAVTMQDLSWRVQISAEIDGVSDRSNYLGLSAVAENGFDPLNDIEGPPESPARSVDLYFNQANWAENSGRYASDIRAADQQAEKIWEFVIKNNFAGQELTLNFSGLDSVPKNVQLELYDLAHNQKLDLKTASVYKCSATSFGNIFQIKMLDTALVPQNTALTLTGLKIYPNPFNPAAVELANIEYTLNSVANGDISIYSITGKLVHTIEIVSGAVGGNAGLNQPTWDGRHNGESCSDGLYFYVINLKDSTGNEVHKRGKAVIWKN